MNVYNTLYFGHSRVPVIFNQQSNTFGVVDDYEPNLLGLWWILCVALMVGWNEK